MIVCQNSQKGSCVRSLFFNVKHEALFVVALAMSQTAAMGAICLIEVTRVSC